MRSKVGIEQEPISVTLIKEAEAVSTGVKFFILALIKNIERQRNKASKFGIKTFNFQTLTPKLEECLENIQQSIEEMKQKVKGNQLGSEDKDLLTLQKNYECAKKETMRLSDLLVDYNENSKKDLKRTLDTKVQEMIYKTECDKLRGERKFLIFKPESFMDRILGRTRLRDARIRNIDVRIKRAEARKKIVNSIRRVEEMLKDMYTCVDDCNNGVLTDEMQEIEDAIRQIFDRVKTREEIMSEKVDNARKGLQVTTNKRKNLSWMKNWKEARRLDKETDELEQENQNITDNRADEENPYGILTQIYNEINTRLGNIEKLIAVRGRESELKIDKSLKILEQ